MAHRSWLAPLLAALAAGVVIAGCGSVSAPSSPAGPSPSASGRAPAAVRTSPSTPRVPPRRPTPAPRRVTPTPARPAGPLPGTLLIADKGNNRILIMSPGKKILWAFPRLGDLRAGQEFLVPDDAFFTPGRRTIIATEEDYNVVREIDIRTHRVVWQYGHPGVPGSAPGYLNGPDDAYRLPDGLTTIADIRNCRLLLIGRTGQIVRQSGTPGNCVHDPPQAFASPNGDTPLPDGGMLVSEIGGAWIDRLDARGHLVWAIQSPLLYPSDPQLLPDGGILVCDYTFPGRIVELDAHGHLRASFGDAAGPNLLNHPSLAIRLPNGLVALNDDWNHRVIIVDMRAHRILWQYGVTAYYGSAPGYLNNPDGIDFLPVAGNTP